MKTPKNSPISLLKLKRNYCNTRRTSSTKFIAITLHPHIYLATYNYAFNRVPIERGGASRNGRVATTGDQWADSLGSKKNPSPLLQFPILIFFLFPPSPPLPFPSFPRSHRAIHPGISGCNLRWKGGCVHGDQGNLVTISQRQRSKNWVEEDLGLLGWLIKSDRVFSPKENRRVLG